MIFGGGDGMGSRASHGITKSSRDGTTVPSHRNFEDGVTSRYIFKCPSLVSCSRYQPCLCSPNHQRESNSTKRLYWECGITPLRRRPPPLLNALLQKKVVKNIILTPFFSCGSGFVVPKHEQNQRWCLPLTLKLSPPRQCALPELQLELQLKTRVSGWLRTATTSW